MWTEFIMHFVVLAVSTLFLLISTIFIAITTLSHPFQFNETRDLPRFAGWTQQNQGLIESCPLHQNRYVFRPNLLWI
jgi:hypothetical protein